jgi:hypothetical protein
MIAERAKFLRQYFKFIRAGAIRIEASSQDPPFDPLAFINKDGKYVVVLKAAKGGSFSIEGLPPGKYGIKYTTHDEYDKARSDTTLQKDKELKTSIPDRGIITIYGK